MKVRKQKEVGMKGRLKAVITSAFAFVLALTTVVPAYAASTPAGNSYEASKGMGSTSSLEVSTANSGDTLGAFQVISIDYKSDNTLDYQFTQDFKDFLGSTQYTDYTAAGGKAVATVDDYKALTSVAAGDSGDLSNLLGAFTKYVKANGKTAKYTANAPDGTATFTNVDKGQYIIVGMGNTTGALVYQTVTAEVEPKAEGGVYKLNDKYTVAMKTTQPTPEKKITGGTTDDDGIPTVSIGDKINYEISATVPTYPAGATNTTFYMKDTLSAGLSLASTADEIVVKGDGTTLTKDTDYTVTINGQSLYIDLKYDQVKQYSKITAAYDAILNENAKTGSTTGNPNTYDLIWSNNPYNGETHEDHPGDNDEPGYGKETKEKTVYSYALRVEKIEKDKPGVHLKGATFDILSSDKQNVLGTITTDDNGFAAFSGLEAGTYYLRETVAPTGYKLMTEDIEIKLDKTTAVASVTTTTTKTYTTVQDDAKIKTQAVDESGVPLWLPTGAAADTAPTAAATAPAGMVPAYLKTITTTVSQQGGTGTAAQGFFETKVEDVPGSNLPSTGGMGTTILYIVGGALVLGSAVFMITKKRMANAEQ